MNKIALKMLENLIPLVVSMLSDDDARLALIQLLDAVEKWASNSTNKIDDAVVLPVTAKIRKILNLDKGVRWQ